MGWEGREERNKPGGSTIDLLVIRRIGDNSLGEGVSGRDPGAGLLSLRGSLTQRARGIRMGMLLGATALMGLGDLDMTLQFVRNVGMIEANPLARSLMEGQSPLPVVLFKLGSIFFCVGVLFMARRRRHAEVAAWACFLVMAALTMHWNRYSAEVSAMTPEVNALAEAGDPHWVSMDP